MAAPTEIDLKAYEQLQADSAELKRLKESGTISKADYDAKIGDLEARLKKEEDRKKAIDRTEFRAKLKTAMEEVAGELNVNHFDSLLKAKKLGEIMKEVAESFADEAVDKYMRDTVDGLNDAKIEAKKRLHASMVETYKEYREIEGDLRANNIVKSFNKESMPNVNALSTERRIYGDHSEKTYFTDEARKKSGHSVRDQLHLFIMSEALKRPMIKNRDTGETWFQEHQRIYQPNPNEPSVMDLQRNYVLGSAHSEGDFFAPGGQIYNLFQSEALKNRLTKMFHSDFLKEDVMTTANTISNLSTDFSSLIVMATWPLLIAKQIAAKTGVMTDKTKRVYEMAIPRSDTDPFSDNKHWFGAVDSDTPTALDTSKTLTTSGVVVADAGSLASATNGAPSEVWGILGEVVDADTTITITCVIPPTATSGTLTTTATVTFLTTDTVGTVKRFTSAGLLGDKYLDVTGVSSTGWTDAAAKGEVGIFAPQPWREHTAGSQGDEVSFDIDSDDVTATTYNKVARLTLEVLEDLQMSVNNGSIDGVAMLLTLLQSALKNAIDSRLLYSLIANTASTNQRTFNANTPDPDYSQQSWKALLKYEIEQAMNNVHHSCGQMPTNIIWNFYDRTPFNNWLTQGQGDLTPIHPDANDPFAGGKAQYRLAGGDVYVSENQQTEFVSLTGGPLYGVHSYDLVPLKVMQAPDPGKNFEQVIMVRSRGFHGVPSTSKIYGGRSIGFLKVVRR